MMADFLVPLLPDGVEFRQQGRSTLIQTMLELPQTASFDLVASMTSAEISHWTEKILCAGGESPRAPDVFGLRRLVGVDSLDILFEGGTGASASCF